MNIKISAMHIDLTPALKDYIERRLIGINKFTVGEPAIDVEIGKTTEHHRQGEIFIAKVNVITVLGKQYRAVSEKSDLYEAIDDIRDEIIRELSTSKDKRNTLFRRGSKKIKDILKGFRS